VLEVSPQGEILRKISLIELLYANDLIGALFPVGYQLLNGHQKDVLHTNDVEILSRKDAAAFPLFEAGDAVVSSRHGDVPSHEVQSRSRSHGKVASSCTKYRLQCKAPIRSSPMLWA
jgi:hypothetical protein